MKGDIVNIKLSFLQSTFTFYIGWGSKHSFINFLRRNDVLLLSFFLMIISVTSFTIFYLNGLGLAYNDARSHLDIGRRVVEGLKPGFAQLGSVWLPLPHILMIPTIWNDFMWHTGLSGALISMISFVVTGALIYLFLKQLEVGVIGRLLGVLVFVSNLNILYLQSTAMTELLLIATMSAGVYELLLWYKSDNFLHLILSAFWTMLATLVRYDGWFLLICGVFLVGIRILKNNGFKRNPLEGVVILFSTLGGFGIFLWFLWNLVIFNDPLYFIYGPYSAYAQQKVLEGAGDLVTKGNLLLSIKTYFLALAYNSGPVVAFLGFLGSLIIMLNRNIPLNIKIALLGLFAPLIFNIIALYLGHSVLYIQGLSGDTWFNIRYGVMMVPSFAIFIGFLIHAVKPLRIVFISLIAFITFFTFVNADAVTVDDAKTGASQKNVTEVSTWLTQHAGNKEGFVLISAASHDAIIFSSGLPMKRFIHEGTGTYWKKAISNPSKWARWIIMRTHDKSDLTYKEIIDNPDFNEYELVGKYPFADIYQLKNEYLKELKTGASIAQ